MLIGFRGLGFEGHGSCDFGLAGGGLGLRVSGGRVGFESRVQSLGPSSSGLQAPKSHGMFRL